MSIYYFLTLSSTNTLPSGKATLISTWTLLANSSNRRILIASYTFSRTLIQDGLVVRHVNDDEPICAELVIRGPEATRARRPWAPPALAAVVATVPPLDDDESEEIEEAISAARTAGSSDFHREETSSGMTTALSSAMIIILLSEVEVCEMAGETGAEISTNVVAQNNALLQSASES